MIIESCIVCFIFALCSALCTLFLDGAMNEGHIFAPYYLWLERITSKYNDKGKKIGHYPIFKPLGGCSKCMNVWIAVISFILVSYFANIQWWWVFPYIFLSSFMFMYAKKLTNESD